MARVLIVDDEESIRITIGAFVTKNGHTVALACDALEALNLLREEPFDVVISDIILPRKTGVELLGDIREIQPDVQVIMITGEPEVKSAAEAVRKGAFDYLAKPISRERITKTITAAVEKKALIDANSRLAEENRKHREHLEQLVDERTAQLKDSEEKYRTLFSGIADPIFVFDDETKRFLECNQSALNCYGYAVEDLHAMTPPDLHPAEEQQHVREDMADMSNLGPNQYTHVTKAGTCFPVEVLTTGLEYQRKRAWISIVRDISVRKQMEKALEGKERYYRSLIHTLHEDILVIDRDYRITDVNNAFLMTTGHKREDVIGKRCYEALHALAEPCAEHSETCLLQDVFETGGSRQCRHEHRQADGSKVWVGILLSPLKDDAGTVTHVIEAARDISDLVQSENALRNSRDQLQKAQHISRMGFLDWDLKTDEIYWSDEIYDLYGIDRDVLITPDLTRELIHPDDRAFVVESLECALKGEEGYDIDHRNVRPDGTVLWLHAQGSIVVDDDGTPGRFLVTVQDISERIRAAEKLRIIMNGAIQAVAQTTEMRDPYTAGHQRRVSQLAAAIAEGSGLPADQVEAIRVCGLLHDIGKMGVPAEILSKPSKLTGTELSLLQAHPQAAFDILRSIEFPWLVADIVLQHHERQDGSGYPQGLVGDVICIEARILAVADVVEAMSSHRPYRPALGIDAALDEIESKKGQLYDSGVVETCLRLFRTEAFEFLQDAGSK